MTLMIWLGLAVVGASASAGFLIRLQFRLRHRSNRRNEGDGWQRGRPALLGLILGLLVTGAGLGGALSTALQPPVVVEPAVPPMRGWSEPDSALSRTRGIRRDSVAPVDTALAPVRRSEGPTGTGIVPDSTRVPVAVPDSTRVPAAVPGSTSGEWAVRVGVFGVRDNAQAVVDRLDAAGLDGFIVPRTDAEGRRLSYVYAGRFARRDSADATAGRVRDAGMDAMVVAFTPAGS